jgi:hypothetical protein
MIGEMLAFIVCVLLYALGWLLWPACSSWLKSRKQLR